MISKNQLKLIHSLSLKKFRDEEKAFVAEGVKLVDELLASDFNIRMIFGLAEWYASRRDSIPQAKFQEINNEELQRATGMPAPSEVLAIVEIPEQTIPASPEAGKLVLLLDRIQDPGNLGTIIRTADWFGIKHIFCSPGTVDVYNPKVVQSTMGSICRVKVHNADLVSLIQDSLNDRHIYATTMDGENIYTADLQFPAAIIIGNESQGISRDILEMASHKIGIPNFSSEAESLNASVAAGIVCSEFCRRI
jgi:RNA methyltransferase, TrmH family